MDVDEIQSIQIFKVHHTEEWILDENATDRITVNLMKWRVTRVLCNHNIPNKIKVNSIQVLSDKLNYVELNIGHLRYNLSTR